MKVKPQLRVWQASRHSRLSALVGVVGVLVGMLAIAAGPVVFSVRVESVLLSILGGVFPAIRAARLSIALGLRES